MQPSLQGSPWVTVCPLSLCATRYCLALPTPWHRLPKPCKIHRTASGPPIASAAMSLSAEGNTRQELPTQSALPNKPRRVPQRAAPSLPSVGPGLCGAPVPISMRHLPQWEWKEPGSGVRRPPGIRLPLTSRVAPGGHGCPTALSWQE